MSTVEHTLPACIICMVGQTHNMRGLCLAVHCQPGTHHKTAVTARYSLAYSPVIAALTQLDSTWASVDQSGLCQMHHTP